MRASSGPRQHQVACLTIVLAFLVATRIAQYRGGFGDSDSMMMAAALRQACLSGARLQEPLLYFPRGQPFYYAGSFLWPGTAAWSVHEIAQAMNLLSWVSSGLTLLLLVWMLRRRFDAEIAVVAGATVATSPVVLEMATFGHPMTVAAALVLIATFVLAERDFVRGPRRSALLLAASGVCLFLALGTRTDVAVLILPALATVFLASSARRPRRLAILWPPFIAGLAYVIVLHTLRFASAETTTPLSLLSTFVQAAHPRSLAVAVAKCVLAVGIGTSLAFLLALRPMLRLRSGWLGLVSLLPCLAVALANPFPARRFDYVVLGLSLVGAAAFARGRLSGGPRYGRAVAATTLLVGPLNLGAPGAMGAITRVLGVDPRAHAFLDHATTGIVERHRANQEYLTWEHALWATLPERLEEHCLLVGGWGTHARLLYAWSERDQKVERRTPARYGRSEVFEFRVARGTHRLWSVYANEAPNAALQESCAVFLMRYPESMHERFGHVLDLAPPSNLRYRFD